MNAFFLYSSSAWLGVLITMKFTRYLLLFHFSRADRPVQIWIHFADNVDESKNCLPTWHMGFCKLERETGGRRQEGRRGSASDTQCPGRGCRDSKSVWTSGKGWAGQGNGNGEKGRNKTRQHFAGGACVKWGEGVQAGSALGEESPEWAEIRVWWKESTRPALKAWHGGYSWHSHDSRGWECEKSLCEQGPRGKFSCLWCLLGSWAQDRDLVSHKLAALPPSCSTSSGCDMFVSGAVESSCSWCACLGIFSRCFAL